MESTGALASFHRWARGPKRPAGWLAATLVGCILHISMVEVALADNTGWRGETNVPRIEVLQLPQFCWARYIKEMQSAEYRISYPSCGPNTNHYCDALLGFNKAMRAPAGSKDRANGLRGAREGVVYTLGGIEGYKACPIRQHVEATLYRIDSVLLGQAPGAKR